MSAAIALASLILLALGWFALRWTEESRRMDDLIATVKTTSAGSNRKGGRVGTGRCYVGPVPDHGLAPT